MTEPLGARGSSRSAATQSPPTFGSPSATPPLFARPPAMPSLFPRAAFPQDDAASRFGQHRAILKSPTSATAADNLLSLIHSAPPTQAPPIWRSDRSGDKEAADDDSDGNTSEEQQAGMAESAAAPGKKQVKQEKKRQEKGKSEEGATPKRRYKKPTYIVRREKKEVLEEELRALSADLARLRRESGIPDWFFRQKEQIADKSQENVQLRDAMRRQDMFLSNAMRLMLAEYMCIHTESPIETFIHLTADLKLRRQTLMHLKDFKLEQANRFITESSRHMHPVKHWCQESKYEADNGDFCAIKMDNTPFYNVKSVRQVFDALQFFFRNMEISISEMLGDITVREDDDTPDNSLSNHRLVSVMSHNVKVEKNIVKFFKYVEPEDGSVPYALVATDAVDVDEMYPYIPEERMRIDINAAMKFTEHRVRKSRKRSRTDASASSSAEATGRSQGTTNSDSPQGGREKDDEDDEFERVVVLTRFFRAKLHHTELDLPPHVLQEIRQGLACFTDTMVKTMHRIIYETKRG